MCNCRVCIIGKYVISNFGENSYNDWDFKTSELDYQYFKAHRNNKKPNLKYCILDFLYYNKVFVWLKYNFKRKAK